MSTESLTRETFDRHLSEIARTCPALDEATGAIVFPASPNGAYFINAAECATHARIIHWIAHLADKKWITPRQLKGFIQVACNHHGLKVWQF